jgi:hypothetical protein
MEKKTSTHQIPIPRGPKHSCRYISKHRSTLALDIYSPAPNTRARILQRNQPHGRDPSALPASTASNGKAILTCSKDRYPMQLLLHRIVTSASGNHLQIDFCCRRPTLLLTAQRVVCMWSGKGVEGLAQYPGRRLHAP